MRLSVPNFRRKATSPSPPTYTANEATAKASPPPYRATAEKTTTPTRDESAGWAVPADEAPTLREWARNHADRILPRLALPMGLLAFSGIFAGTTYALVARVQHLVATARVSSDPAVWMQEARTKGYDACYFGCTDDCNDVNFAWNACTRTALANVSGIDCAAARMWNWKDRYPRECLMAVGEFFRSDALEALKQSYRNQLAIIILTFLGGLVGGIVAYKVWKRWTAHRVERARSWGNRFGAPKWPRPFKAPAWRTKRSAARQHRGGNWLKLMLAGLPWFGRPANAYACTGYDAVHDQYFANGNRTIFGVVHGWFSNCYDVEQCSTTCSTSCTGGESNSCTTSCSTYCWTVTYSDRAPVQFVEDVLPRVQACGFTLQDQVEGDVNVRVANAGIERFWWLKISVNGYNITDTRDTDDQILCLYDIGSNAKA